MKTSEAKTNYPFVSPTPGQITILAKSPYRDGKSETITKDVFNTIVNCGFNAIVVIDSIENTRKCFETLSGIKLRIIMGAIGDDKKPEMRKNNMNTLANEFHNNSLSSH